MVQSVKKFCLGPIRFDVNSSRKIILFPVFIITSHLLFTSCGSLKEVTGLRAEYKNENETVELKNLTNYSLSLRSNTCSFTETIPSKSRMRILPGVYTIEAKGINERGIPAEGVECSVPLNAELWYSYTVKLKFNRTLENPNDIYFKYSCDLLVQREVVEQPNVEIDIRSHNIFQLEYNYMITSGFLNSTTFLEGTKVPINTSNAFNGNSAGIGFYFLHLYKIYDDMYMGYRIGNLFSLSNKQYYSRVIFPGLLFRYYSKADWFLSGELNLGINLSGLFDFPHHSMYEEQVYGRISKHDYAISQVYYSIGIGKQLLHWLGLIIKYNHPFNHFSGE